MLFTRTFFLIIALLPVFAVADDDVIVVTATRNEIALQDVIVPVTIINREQIELAAARDVTELLRFEAGLDIGRNGGPGQASSVFLRGTESNHTLVLIDGVRINPGTIGGAALQNISPELIERIEIVKGARSSLYGTDAIGGVINIITRRAGSGYAEAGASAGSFSTQSAYTSFGAATDAGELGVTLNVQDTDGYAVRADSEIERGYDNFSANIYGSRQIGRSTVNLRHWSARGNSEYLDFFLAPVDQDYQNQSSALEVTTPLGERSESRLLLSHMIDKIDQNQSPDFVTSRRYALDWLYSVSLPGHNLAAGIYATEENARAESFGSGFSEDTATRALFLQDSITRGRLRAFLAGRYTDHETFGNEFTWNAEVAFDLNDAWSLSAGMARAFRAPDATDRFGFGGNTTLRPEVADEIQLGVEVEVNPRNLLRFDLFSNDINDLIEFDFNSFTLQNLARAKIRGGQLGWTYRGDLFRLRADLVSQSAENAADGSKLLRRAERSLTINVTREIGNHLLGLSMLASSRRQDIAESLPGYVLLNVTGQFKLGQHWQLHSRLENLLNTRYQTAAPYQMAERSVFLELKYRW
ncbi:MAG: TonB-dependent receptor [Woeseia sp.]|nr:TonB-dependent receptor [Woeseia sp.]MBT8096932.1 TonB-dependent receptor [Woeseia sp.]NNE61592.1 TonB-dependent receptor [Woeseia sp.]NNL55487.1 TonB-dependent receptor [Woeseia sp.]